MIKIKKIQIFMFIVIVFNLITCQFFVVDAWSDRSYDELIEAFMEFETSYPSLVSHETVGTTVEGRDILMFKVGDPNGERVLFDGAIHGWETVTSEVLYLYAEWLLTSHDSVGIEIRNNVCTLLIPAINVDNYNEERKNANGVDLNRNFALNWEHGGYTDPTSEYYRGPSPLSEPESSSLVEVFQQYRPKFYGNLHEGATYYAGCGGDSTYYQEIVEKVNDFADDRGINAYDYHGEFGGSGMAIGDAANEGIMSFLFELDDPHTSFDIETDIFPRFMASAAIISQELISNDVPDEPIPNDPPSDDPVIVDYSPPVTNHDYDGSWRNADFTITLSAEDNFSGVAQTYYRINGGETKTVSIDGQPIICFESENSSLEYWSVDNLGNIEIFKTINGIKLDKSAPNSITIFDGNLADNEWFTSKVNVSINASDFGSGINQTEYSFDNSTWTTFETPFLVDIEGNYSIYYRTKDNAKNLETPKIAVLKIDRTAPNIQLDINATESYIEADQDLILTIDATDNMSGIENGTVSYYLNNTSNLVVIPLDFKGDNQSEEVIIPSQSEGAELNLEIEVFDNAGNKQTRSYTYQYVSSYVPEFSSTLFITICLVAPVFMLLIKKKFNKK